MGDSGEICGVTPAGSGCESGGQAVDDFLPAGFVSVVAAVVPVHLEVAQAVERLAADRTEPRHAGERDFQRDGDLALDFFGRRTGELGEDFDDGRRRIGIRLDVDVEERIRADDRQSATAKSTTTSGLAVPTR